jgi:hypothetical protein
MTSDVENFSVLGPAGGFRLYLRNPQHTMTRMFISVAVKSSLISIYNSFFSKTLGKLYTLGK